MSSEPLIEPLIEPILIEQRLASLMSSEDSNKETRKRLGERGASPKAECYRLVREHYGESRVGLVSRALEVDSPEEVLDEILDAIETENNIGYALWRP